MKAVESIIAALSPSWSLNRIRARKAAEVLARYDAATYSDKRTGKISNESGNLLVQQANDRLMGYARNLEQNDPLAKSVILTASNNVIGSKGICFEPMPKNLQKQEHADFKQQLTEGFKRATQKIEVRRDLSWVMLQIRLYQRAFVDGEVFVQHLTGGAVNAGRDIPYSVELIESDRCPLMYTEPGNNIYQGIQFDEWGAPLNYFFYRKHPNDIYYSGSSLNAMDLIKIPAERISHYKHADRIGQIRGVTRFHSAMKMFEWINTYMRSELLSGVIASFFGVKITKNGQNYDDSTDSTKRSIELDGGILVDDLAPGEDVEVIANARPNGNSAVFIDLANKLNCAGIGVDFANVTNNYDGNYASRRAARNDAQTNYEVDAENISMILETIYVNHIKAGLLSGYYQIPADLDIKTLFDVELTSPRMPEVDPTKDAKAAEIYLLNKIKSRHQVIRELGGNPVKVDAEIKGDEINVGMDNNTNNSAAGVIDNAT
jgi:lambda family phage portal protein